MQQPPYRSPHPSPPNRPVALDDSVSQITSLPCLNPPVVSHCVPAPHPVLQGPARSASVYPPASCCAPAPPHPLEPLCASGPSLSFLRLLGVFLQRLCTRGPGLCGANPWLSPVCSMGIRRSELPGPIFFLYHFVV